MRGSELIRLSSCGSGRDAPEIAVEASEHHLNQFRMKHGIKLSGDVFTVFAYQQSETQLVLINKYLGIEICFIYP